MTGAFVLIVAQIYLRMIHSMQFPVFSQPVSEALVIICRSTENLSDRLNRKIIGVSQHFFVLIYKGGHTSVHFLFPLNRKTTSANQ